MKIRHLPEPETLAREMTPDAIADLRAAADGTSATSEITPLGRAVLTALDQARKTD